MERFLKKKAVPSSSNNSKADAHRTVDASITEVEVGQKQLPDVSLSMRSTRANIDNLQKLLGIAKLFDVKGEVQQIEFSSPLLSGDYRLIEVNPKLADRIESGEGLVFRGELDDNPVLCTKQETYQVKEAETSNTLLVLPTMHFANEVGNGDRFLTARKVVAMHSRYVELRRLDVVSLNRLKELLKENEIDWDETENPEQEGKLYTLDDLLNVVQMSEEQLMNALHCLPVIHQHGYLRMLSSTYRDRLLMELTECCDDEDEPLVEVNSISIEAFNEAIARRNPTRTVPNEAIGWLIDTHCNRIIDDGGSERFALDERAVCRSKASQLLRAAVRFEYSAFEKLLRQMLPEGIEMKDEYLNGLALLDNSLTKGNTVRYMNVEDMPHDEYKRLQLLFSIRSRWKVADIQHFLTDLCPTSRAVSEVLAKYCRHSTGDGERYVVGLK